jgi:hypothetical protein
VVGGLAAKQTGSAVQENRNQKQKPHEVAKHESAGRSQHQIQQLEYVHTLGGMLLIPRLRPKRLDGTGPKAIMSPISAAAELSVLGYAIRFSRPPFGGPGCWGKGSCAWC